jgi:hypothetical protein
MSGLARKFAQKDYTINIFILNMCQEILKDNVLTKSQSLPSIYNEEKKQHEFPFDPDNPGFEYLSHDTRGSHNEFTGYS